MATLREEGEPPLVYFKAVSSKAADESHFRGGRRGKIGGMSVNPLRPRCIAVASLDQHIRLFDVRAMRSLPTEDIAPYSVRHVDFDALEKTVEAAQIGEHQARLACTSVDFSPRGDNLVGVSYDDVVKGERAWDVVLPGSFKGAPDVWTPRASIVWDVHPNWLARGAATTVRKRASVKVEAEIAKGPAPKPNGNPQIAEDASALRQSRRSAPARPQPVKRESSGLLRWFTSKGESKTEPSAEIEDAPDAAVTVQRRGATSARQLALGEREDEEWTDLPDAPARPSDVLQSPHVIPHNNQTGKWLTLFRARWNANAEAEPHFTVSCWLMNVVPTVLARCLDPMLTAPTRPRPHRSDR